jgi:hypothetical protein
MLYQKARDHLHVPFGWVFLNAVFPERFSPQEASAIDLLAREPRPFDLAAQAAFGAAAASSGPALLAATRYAVQRGALTSHYRKELRARIDLPLVEIPYLFVESFGLREVEHVAQVIERGPGGLA